MDGAVPARMQEGVARTYRTDRIEVTWAPRRCIHAGECFGNAPAVFDPGARPWVRPEAADPDLVEDTVLLCPSGALGFRRLDDPSAADESRQRTALKRELGELQENGSLAAGKERDRQLLRNGRLARVEASLTLASIDRVCILCFEGDPAFCHCTIIAEEATRLEPGLTVLQL